MRAIEEAIDKLGRSFMTVPMYLNFQLYNAGNTASNSDELDVRSCCAIKSAKLPRTKGIYTLGAA
jgi:hypothetical protein